MDAYEQTKLMAEIQRDEAWLADVMDRYPVPACDVLESVKHRVRIEAYERSIGLGDLSDASFALTPSPATLGRVKAAVRAELEAESAAPLSCVTSSPYAALSPHIASPARWRGFGIAFGSLAAAAVLVFAFLPIGKMGLEGDQQAEVPPTIEEFVAFVSDVSLEEEAEFAVLETELDDLEQLVVSPLDTWFDGEVDDLDNEFDRLTGESESLFDV